MTGSELHSRDFAMRVTPAQLFEYLETLAITTETLEHPPMYTVEDSKRLRGELPGAHIKNLFIKDKKGALFLISAMETTQINLKTIHETIGGQGRVTFCSAEVLGEVLGVEPGSVTPLAVINDREKRVKVVLDERLLAHERINVHPLVNTMTTGIQRDDLIRFLTVTGHDPLIVQVGTLPEGAA